MFGSKTEGSLDGLKLPKFARGFLGDLQELSILGAGAAAALAGYKAAKQYLPGASSPGYGSIAYKLGAGVLAQTVVSKLPIPGAKGLAKGAGVGLVASGLVELANMLVGEKTFELGDAEYEDSLAGAPVEVELAEASLAASPVEVEQLSGVGSVIS